MATMDIWSSNEFQIFWLQKVITITIWLQCGQVAQKINLWIATICTMNAFSQLPRFWSQKNPVSFEKMSSYVNKYFIAYTKDKQLSSLPDKKFIKNQNKTKYNCLVLCP